MIISRTAQRATQEYFFVKRTHSWIQQLIPQSHHQEQQQQCRRLLFCHTAYSSTFPEISARLKPLYPLSCCSCEKTRERKIIQRKGEKRKGKENNFALLLPTKKERKSLKYFFFLVHVICVQHCIIIRDINTCSHIFYAIQQQKYMLCCWFLYSAVGKHFIQKKPIHMNVSILSQEYGRTIYQVR